MFSFKRDKSAPEHGLHLIVSNNPIGVVEFLRDYGIEELGALFIYLPIPTRAADAEARSWLSIARDLEIINGGPWVIDAVNRRRRLEDTHPNLYRSDPQKFEVYRLDRAKLGQVVKGLVEPGASSKVRA